jgi:hypothetical protein
LRERREQLFASGRKQQEHDASKECTFSPHLRQKSGKNMTLDAAEGFYQKNIDWQRKVQKETKLKQCEKINEGVTGLTFTPKIVALPPCRTPAGTNPTRKTCLCLRRRAWSSSCSGSSERSTASRPSRAGRRTPTRRSGTSRSANSPTSTDIEYISHLPHYHDEYLTSSPISEPFFSFIINVSTRSSYSLQ